LYALRMTLKAALSVFLFFCLTPARAGELADIKAEDLGSYQLNLPLPERSPKVAGLLPLNEKNLPPEKLSANPLIVVHATSFFDGDKTAKAGTDKTVSSFRKKGESVVYLVSDQSEEGYAGWYTGERSPDYEIFSAGGEHNLPLAGNEVTVAGGFFGSYDGARGCHALATRDAIRMHFELSDRPFAVNVPLEAVYFYGEDLRTREELLNLDSSKDDPEKIKKIFDRFAELFFLVDNFETSEEDAVGFAHPFNSPAENPSYRPGEPVDTARYSFEIFFKGVSVSKFGKGPRKVALKLANEVK